MRYFSHHFETAVLRVYIDILMCSDAGSLLGLLGLSPAFDAVDHHFLIMNFYDSVCISDKALNWFRSCLTDRSFTVSFGDSASDPCPLSCGVPQGSFLEPLLFS